MAKMNPQVKAKWVAALRSGEYKQGKKQLRESGNAFCCLGVLCNLHAQTHPEIAAKERHQYIYMGEWCFLPDSVMRWAGLSHDWGESVDIAGRVAGLTTQNDSGASFSQIADAIEAQL